MTSEECTETSRDRRHPVLQLFGVELEVSSPRLAELLTMDAKEALSTDVRELAGGAAISAARADAAEAVPDVLLAPLVARDKEEARRRHEFRSSVHEIGTALGFEAGVDGQWHSPSGLTILTRAVEHPVSFAAASHYVNEIASRHEMIAGRDSTALFVVDSQQTADVFKVAVRQRRLHDVMRTISLDNLREIRSLCAAGHLDHRQALALLVPIANIDVGELLSILRAAGEGATPAGTDGLPRIA